MDNERTDDVQGITAELISTPKPIALAFYRARTALRIQVLFPNVKPGDRYPQTGGFMFTFAESAGGDNKYDWSKEGSVSFFLSAAEVGGFVNAVETAGGLNVYHDPDKGRANEGTRVKTMSLVASNDSYWLNIGMRDRRFGIKLEAADQRQLALMLGHSLRLCYGWY